MFCASVVGASKSNNGIEAQAISRPRTYAGQRQKEAFEKGAANKPRAGHAERDLNGDFALLSGSTRELQAGNVRAGDQQDRHDSSEEKKQRFAQIAGDEVNQRHAEHAPTGGPTKTTSSPRRQRVEMI